MSELEIASVDDQIAVIDRMIKDRPDLSNPLELHKKILEAQRQIRGSPKKGTNLDWADKSIIDDLQRKAVKSGQPIAIFIDSSIFDSKALLHTIEQVIGALIEKGVKEDWPKNLLDEVKRGETNILDLVSAALKGDVEYFNRHGERFGVSPALILFIVNSLIQPCLEEISKRVDPSFLERWWKAPCPICGRRPMVAMLRARKRHLSCTLCGAVYLADLFLCVNCENVDPYSLKFLAPEGHPEFRVDFCEKCMHYLKVVDESRLKNPIPRGFEDMMTIDLDLMAKRAGLIRA